MAHAKRQRPESFSKELFQKGQTASTARPLEGRLPKPGQNMS